ncbi:MAG TPA: hypothetical protein ACFCUD_09975 [Cyclobacteriaceae bacterium]
MKGIEVEAKKTRQKIFFIGNIYTDSDVPKVGNATFLDIHGQKAQVKDPPFDSSAPMILENVIRKVSYDVEYFYSAPRAYTEAYQEINNDGVIKRTGQDSISYNTITSYRNVNNVLENYQMSNEHKFYQGFFDTGNQAQDVAQTLTLNYITGDLTRHASGLYGGDVIAMKADK